MPFQIKDFVSIVASEINHAKAVTEKITDFLPGSVARTLMEAPAVEIEELYLQMFLGLRDAIPVATFRSFGFDKLPAAYAVGVVSVSSEDPLVEPITIPAGTVFNAIDGRVYTSLAEVVWAAGATQVTVQVRHSTPGVAGNTAAGVITSSPFFDEFLFSVSNQSIFSGKDAESDAERESRFADFVRSLSRGTVVACLHAARSAVVLDANGDMLEYITRVGIDEQPGYVRLYAYSSMGIPSEAILLDGQRRLDGERDDQAGVITPGYRAAGVRVDLLPMVEREVDISVQVGMFPGFELTVEVQQAITDIYSSAISNVLPGSTLYLGTLVELMLAAPGVRTIVPSTSENVICDVNEALVPGVVTVTPLAA